MKIDWQDIIYDITHWRPFGKTHELWQSIKHGVPNLIKWAPIVWKDRNFDYEFLEDMLRFKLTNMMNFFNGRNAMALDSQKFAEKIKEVLTLLERLKEDNYIESIGYVSHPFKTEEIKENGVTLHRLLDERTDEEKEWDWNAFKSSQQMRENDRLRAYQLIAENLMNWWD